MADTTFRKGSIGFEDLELGTGTFIREDHNRANKSFTQINLSQVPRKVITKDASYTVTEKYTVTFTNKDAAGSITFSLPVAIAGLGPYNFLCEEAQEIQVDPNGTEYFRGSSAGKYKYSDIQGNMLTVWCDVNGIWEWTQHLVSENWDDET